MDVTAKAETLMQNSFYLIVFAFCSNFGLRFAYGHRRSGNQWYCVWYLEVRSKRTMSFVYTPFGANQNRTSGVKGAFVEVSGRLQVV